MKDGQVARIRLPVQQAVFRLDIKTVDRGSIHLTSGFTLALDEMEDGRFHMWTGHFMHADNLNTDLGIDYYSAALGSAAAEKIVSDAIDFLLKSFDDAKHAFADAAVRVV
jgi:hypothetical protein